MNLSIPKVGYIKYTPFKGGSDKTFAQPYAEKAPLPVYGDTEIRTNPAQLSLFHMHDFHGQNIRMERAYSAAKEFESGTLTNQNAFFDTKKPVDKLKLCSGDMFLGENHDELAVVNEFLNISGVIANAIGNHECDTFINDFVKKVGTRKYRLLSANMHPDMKNRINSIISNSFIVELNGNRYGIIGLSPIDMHNHMKRPEEVFAFNISDMESTAKDLQKDIERIKSKGVNKIILLSHLGLQNEQYLAKNISDIDVILGGHTHNLMTEVKEGENLFMSPKNEPVLIMQVGRDGEHIGVPNLKFNELGQITEIQYNVLNTDEFERSLVAKKSFESILGKPEVVGKLLSVEEPPKDIYANENPHCDFIMDCLKSELNTDIAIMNAANIRSKFFKGDVDTRDLKLISPFGNNVVVIEASEKEIVDAIKRRVKITMDSPAHRPGILQVSGLKYEFSAKDGVVKSISFIDKSGKEHPLDIENPRDTVLYTIATDDYCAESKTGGLGLNHRLENALEFFNCDKDEFVADFMRKQNEPMIIKSDGRIKIVD